MKKDHSIQNSIIAPIGVIALSFTLAFKAVAEPVINFTNPYKIGKNKTVALDCAPLKQGFTCAFAEQLDGQEICDDDEIMSQARKQRKTKEETQKLASNLSMIATIYHNGTTHKHCTAQYALTLINSVLKDTDRRIKTKTKFSSAELSSIKTRLRDLSRIKISKTVEYELRQETEDLLKSTARQLIKSLEQNPDDYLKIMHTLIPLLKDKARWRALDDCKPLEAKRLCLEELGM